MEINKELFKTVNNKFITLGLFFETAQDKTYVVYSLRENDYTMSSGKILPSLRRLYLESCESDPSEYTFANTYLFSWRHWKAIRSAPWFQPYLEEWLEEREVRTLSNSLKNIYAKANNPEDKENFQANKFLLSGGYKDKKADPVGRPSKTKIKEEAIKLYKESQTIDEDMERILQ